jgi:hypothetical protein
MAAIGHPLDASSGPIVTNFPIWLAETPGVRALALPAEKPSDIVDLATDPAFAGTRLVIVIGADHGGWPGILDQPGPDVECFHELELGPGPAGRDDPLGDVRAFEIACP